MVDRNVHTPVPVRKGCDSTFQAFEVAYKYPVVFSSSVFSPTNCCLSKVLEEASDSGPRKTLVYIDDGVHRATPGLVQDVRDYLSALNVDVSLVGEVCVLPGGEAAKNDPALIQKIYADIHAQGIDRQDYIFGIGGGAVLDLLGYAAATAHRGIRLLRFPSTVLSQNDSAVGVKNSVNAFGVKNFLGTFAPPYAVICDESLLETLQQRDKRAGIAEAVKVGLIRDPVFFDWLDDNADNLSDFETASVRKMIRRGAELHLEHIASCGDAFESSNARPLDFGHWAAHKLESMTQHALRHGEAVSIGMAIDTLYSVELGWLDNDAGRRVLSMLLRIGLPIWHCALECRSPGGELVVLDGLEEFRQHLGGELSVTMLKSAGQGFQVSNIDKTRMTDVITRLHGIAVDMGLRKVEGLA